MLPLYELIDAIERKSVTDAKSALEKHADPNGRTFYKMSMLQLTEKHHANEVVPLLLEYGANLYELIGNKGEYLLHRAARNENVGFVCVLLEAGMSPNLQNAKGETPLHIAARTGQAYLAKYLLKHGANAVIQDSAGRTPLELAIAADRSELVRLLEPLDTRMTAQSGLYETLDLHRNEPSKMNAASPDTLSPVRESSNGNVAANSFSKRVQSTRVSFVPLGRNGREC